MKNTIYALLVIAFLPMELYSQIHQGSLRVIIENAEEEEIIGAQVAIYQGETLITGGVTDPFGLVQIPAIDPGTYEVEITYVGYKTIRKEKVGIFANHIKSLSVSLESYYLEDYDCCGCPKRPKKKKEPKPRVKMGADAWSIRNPTYGFNSLWSNEEILKMPVR